jgi:hypothetical protein
MTRRVRDRREFDSNPEPCAGCGVPTHLVETIGNVRVGWDDVCWWRLIEKWPYDDTTRARQRSRAVR